MESKDPRATTKLPEFESQSEDTAGAPASGLMRDEREPVSPVLILVVDDSADNVAVLSLDLQQEGYRVVTATNGEEAISVACCTLPNLILMDISMPRLDGLGATRRIREIEALRNVPVIAVTAHGTEGFQRAAYDAGVSGYLTKPLDFVRLHLLVARLLAAGGSGNLTGLS
jgi:CheY-like chemotaxis protein